MAEQLYYAISALPMYGGKWGAASFHFGKDFHKVRARALVHACGDHPHIPVILSAGTLPRELEVILSRVPQEQHEAVEDNLSRCADRFFCHKGASFQDGGSTLSTEFVEENKVSAFIASQTQRGQEVLIGRNFAVNRAN